MAEKHTQGDSHVLQKQLVLTIGAGGSQAPWDTQAELGACGYLGAPTQEDLLTVSPQE